MQNMFKNKGVKTLEKPFVVEPKVVNSLVLIVDVNMVITMIKVIEEHVFKDKKPIKNKFATNWEHEQRLQQSFVHTIHEMQAKNSLENLNQKKKHSGIQVGQDY